VSRNWSRASADPELAVGPGRVDTSRTVDVEVVMSSSEEPRTGDTSADHPRSGQDIAEAIEVAERGTSVQEVHDRGTDNTSGEAPVERTRDDPEMTEGQVVLGEGEPGRHRAIGIDVEAGTSGAAQSQPGARVSDRAAAGEEPPPDPSAN
jgi:hypothetical protein